MARPAHRSGVASRKPQPERRALARSYAAWPRHPAAPDGRTLDGDAATAPLLVDAAPALGFARRRRAGGRLLGSLTESASALVELELERDPRLLARLAAAITGQHARYRGSSQRCAASDCIFRNRQRATDHPARDCVNAADRERRCQFAFDRGATARGYRALRAAAGTGRYGTAQERAQG